MMKTVLVLLAITAVASAACPNSCSGHGTCGDSDKCTCWANWQSADCSQRTCKYDIAWATDHWGDAHYYAECSGKGLCDRETGECVCFEGYSGAACKRSVCPNDCSGHGKCRLVQELPAANGDQSPTATGVHQQYNGWDSDKIQACVCDGGYYGPDCSQRFCPKGDDPLTVCDDSIDDNPEVSTQTSETYQVQRISLRFGPLGYYGEASGTPAAAAITNAADNSLNNLALQSGQLALVYTDNHNETWTTPAISKVFDAVGADDYADGVVNIKHALESLPNFKIPGVTVTQAPAVSLEAGKPDGWIDYLVTFDGGDDDNDNDFTDEAANLVANRVSGNQTLLQCQYPLGCQTAGCQPKYEQPKIVLSSAGITASGITLTADSALNTYNLNPLVNDGYGGLTGASIGTAGDGTLETIDFTATHWDAQIAVTVTAGNTGAATDDDLPELVSGGAIANHFIAVTTTAYAKDGTVRTVSVPLQRIPETSTHMDVGFGLALQLGDTSNPIQPAALVGNADDNVILVAVPRCTITQETAAHSQREDVECSNRGACDAATGVCSCYEGFYGDHCALQTILV